MEGALGRELREICEAAGFSLDTEYAKQAEMIRAIREIDELSAEARPTPLQEAALLENLRLVILKTGSHGFLPSVGAQSRLPRWRFLRVTSPAAATAFAGVLRRLGLPIPIALGRGAAQ